jgi:hypothetical protein
VASIGTSFVRKPELAYETSHGASFVTFGSHEASVLAASKVAADLETRRDQRTKPGERALTEAPRGGWPTPEGLEAVRLGNGALYANSLRDVKYADFTQTWDAPDRKLQASLRPIGFD